MMRWQPLALLILTLVVLAPARADTIVLNSGDVIKGSILTRDAQGVRVQQDDQGPVRSIGWSEIARIDSGNIDTPPKPVELVEPGTIRLRGSNTIGEKLGPALVASYLRASGARTVTPLPLNRDELALVTSPSLPTSLPNAVSRFEILSKGTSTAFAALRQKQTDIGMASRQVTEKDLRDEAAPTQALRIEDLRDNHQSEHVIALDGLAVISNSPVAALTKQQLAQIFSGDIKDWGEVGGSPGPITLVIREERSGTRQVFEDIVFKSQRGNPGFPPSAVPFTSSTDVQAKVASTPGAIGFVGVAYAERNHPPLEIDECGLRYTPNRFSIKTEEYPLSRRLFLYTPPGQLPEDVARFVRYTLSAEAQSVIRHNEYIDLAIETDDQKTQEARREFARLNAGQPKTMQEFLDLTEGARRLSATFRFAFGRDDLDSRAAEDIGRLAGYLRDHPSQRVILIGFADNVVRTNLSPEGRVQALQKISMSRAKMIQTALAERGIKVSTVRGFGSEAPVACQDTELGQSKNRRVEVWVQ